MVSDYTRPPVTQATLKGAPSVTVSPVGLAQGLPRNNNADFGPDTPGTTTCGIQEAVNSGIPVQLLEGTFNITTEINNGNTKLPLVIHGAGYGMNPATDAISIPTSGSIIRQGGTGVNGIRLSSPCPNLSLRGFSVVFTQSSTGHGFFIDAETYGNSLASPTETDYTMAQGMEIGPLLVYGVDGGHYAYWFENCNIGTFDTLIFAGGGGIKWRSFRATNDAGAGNRNSGNVQHGFVFGHVSGTPTVPVISFDSLNSHGSLSTPQTNMIRIPYLDIELSANLTQPLVAMDSHTYWIGIDQMNQGDLGAFTSPLSLAGTDCYIIPDTDWAASVTWPVNANGTSRCGQNLSLEDSGIAGQTANIGTKSGIPVRFPNPVWQAGRNYVFANPADPSNTSSLTAVMAGFGSVLALTPKFSGRFRIAVVGQGYSTVGTATVFLALRIGTGTAPVNGAAASGSTIGPSFAVAGTGAGNGVSFQFIQEVGSLVVGTAYWVDLSFYTGNASNPANLHGVQAIVEEI